MPASTAWRCDDRANADMTPRVAPDAGCHCSRCEARRRAIWLRLTRAQRRALTVLHRDVPRHQADLSRRDSVQWPTLRVLQEARDGRPALITQQLLGPRLLHIPTSPFFVINQHGAEILAAGTIQQRKAA